MKKFSHELISCKYMYAHYEHFPSEGVDTEVWIDVTTDLSD